MKKFRSRLAIILTMVMVLTSFTFLGVYADDNETSNEAPAVTEEAGGEDVDAPAEKGDSTENVVLREGESGITEDDLAIDASSVRLLSGNGCVVLRWKKLDVEGVEYTVYDADTGEQVSSSIEDYNYVGDRLEGNYLMCKINKPISEGSSTPTYQYTVQAKVGDVEGVAVTSNRRSPVRTIAYRFTVKKGTKLKKHGGNGPSTYNLKKGQTLICYGFGGGGCYMFKYKGSIFYCAKIRVKKPQALYTIGWNYTPEEAELFVSQKGAHGNQKVFLWCSQFTQHLFYMQKQGDGRWKCTDDWECSTGKPSAPSPTGMYGIKKIEGKWKKHHNIKWWSKFSGTNSVHGQKKGWTFGRPKSNGCVRNPVAKAEKVYWGAKVGTGLLMF